MWRFVLRGETAPLGHQEPISCDTQRRAPRFYRLQTPGGNTLVLYRQCGGTKLVVKVNDRVVPS